MHTIHTTPGFIIESRPRGEAGKLLSIFTRDLGLVLATAQGIRLEKSKLRYHSQEYAVGEFSFVRGKEFWRLTSAGETQRKEAIVPRQARDKQRSKDSQELIVRIASLLRRLLHGEEAHTELFDHLKNSFEFLENSPELSEQQLKTLESVIVFRILHLLGYVGVDKNLDTKIISVPLTVELLNEAEGQRMSMNRHINKALKESHL